MFKLILHQIQFFIFVNIAHLEIGSTVVGTIGKHLATDMQSDITTASATRDMLEVGRTVAAGSHAVVALAMRQHIAAASWTIFIEPSTKDSNNLKFTIAEELLMAQAQTHMVFQGSAKLSPMRYPSFLLQKIV